MSDIPDTLPAGGDLDCEVAERIFGWTDARWDEIGYSGKPPGKETYTEVPKFSTDPAAMMQVVERMKSLGWLVHMLAMADGWVVNARRHILPANGDWQEATFTTDFIQEIGDTLPEAVCIAALSALSREVRP